MMLHISGDHSNTPEDRMQLACAINQILEGQLRAQRLSQKSQKRADTQTPFSKHYSHRPAQKPGKFAHLLSRFREVH